MRISLAFRFLYSVWGGVGVLKNQTDVPEGHVKAGVGFSDQKHHLQCFVLHMLEKGRAKTFIQKLYSHIVISIIEAISPTQKTVSCLRSPECFQMLSIDDVWDLWKGQNRDFPPMTRCMHRAYLSTSLCVRLTEPGSLVLFPLSLDGLFDDSLSGTMKTTLTTFDPVH